MTDWLIFALLLVLSYFIGAIPFGLLIGKTQGKDLRKEGSGNIGSTNALRVLGIPLAACAALCDITKAMFIIIVVHILEATGVWFNPLVINGETCYAIFGLAAVIGHVRPIYLKFKGGKAVASSLGVMLATVPISAVVGLPIFIITVAIWGYVSVSSTIAAIACVIFTWIYYGAIGGQIMTSICITCCCIIICLRHIVNYKRLYNGTENCFKKKKNVEK